MCSRIGSLENQLFEERESQRRADPITVQVTQAFVALAARVPELEAAERYVDGSKGGAEGKLCVTTHRTDELRSSGKPWWRRLFNG